MGDYTHSVPGRENNSFVCKRAISHIARTLTHALSCPEMDARTDWGGGAGKIRRKISGAFVNHTSPWKTEVRDKGVEYLKSGSDETELSLKFECRVKACNFRLISPSVPGLDYDYFSEIIGF